MEELKPSPEVLREAIYNLDEPVIFKNISNNGISGGSMKFLDFDELSRVLRDVPLPFRVGRNGRTHTPQWDIKCPTETMTLNELTKKIEMNDNNWYYFDYKYMHEWFKDKPEVLSAVNWNAFGINKYGDDSTLWIGSRGAHTNCHQDSYGCNLVAQIHGRKQWLLFPPNSGENLSETRIPYEESTIYSKLNFFSPSKINDIDFKKMPKIQILIVLEPGDVLLLPKGWWHFVESLDFSISINVWLPLDTDCQARLKEALVKLIVATIGGELPAAEEVSWSQETLLKLIRKCMEDCKQLKTEISEASTTKKKKRSSWTVDDLSKDYPNFIKKLDHLSEEEFRLFLINQRERFPEVASDTAATVESDDAEEDVLKRIVESFTNCIVIDKVVELLLNEK